MSMRLRNRGSGRLRRSAALFFILTAIDCKVEWAAAAAPSPASEPRYQVELQKDVRVPLRDGGYLVADVYRPRATGTNATPEKFPVLMSMSAYLKELQH